MLVSDNYDELVSPFVLQVRLLSGPFYGDACFRNSYFFQ